MFETDPITLKNLDTTDEDNQVLEPHYHWIVLNATDMKLLMTTGAINSDWTDYGNESLVVRTRCTASRCLA